MFATRDLISLLADGRFHSGGVLAERLGVSRAAVWKRLPRLEALGLDIYRVPGKGYRLAGALELLDVDVIRAAIAEAGLAACVELEVLGETDSTNARVAGTRPAPRTAKAVLAEYQTAGRGRRGREWISPYGSNLYLSVAWTFPTLPKDLTALPLVAAVIAAEALAALQAPVQLKWPNDLYADGRKLGGVLVELQGEPAGQCVAVIGLGINVRMPAAAGADIAQPWTDLAQALGGSTQLLRNRLAGAMVVALVRGLARFEEQGFAPFRETWRALDLFRGREVVLEGGPGPVSGRAAGIDEDGALLIEREGVLSRHLSGDVSLRART